MSCSVEDTKADTAQVALCKFVVALRRQDTDRLKGEYGDNCCPAGPSYLRKRRRSRSDASVCPGSIPGTPCEGQAHSRCFVNTLTPRYRRQGNGPNSSQFRSFSVNLLTFVELPTLLVYQSDLSLCSSQSQVVTVVKEA